VRLADLSCPDALSLSPGNHDLREVSMSKCIRVSTLKIALFAVPAIVILAGIGVWTASTTKARLETAPGVRIDPFPIMINSKELPVENFTDYSFVFNE
jgi:hypothetical protein